MNSVCVVITDKSMTLGEIQENINPANWLKAEFDKENREFVFCGELSDRDFDWMLTGIKMCPLCGCYDVYKNGQKVW